MRRLGYTIIGFAVVTAVITCKKAYNPAVSNADSNILVVEGMINSGGDSTIIKLTRSDKINAAHVNNATANAELKATVTVEGDNNTSYPLKETADGLYVSAGLMLDASRNYRLHIKTSDGQEYLSDPEPAKASPPIDSVGFNLTNTGLTVYANAHDPANNTRYYRYTYAETWMFGTPYKSEFLRVCSNLPEFAEPRLQPINLCFANSTSDDIVLASTTKLTQDVVERAPITNILSTAEKLSVRYSILVKQYALSKPAYEFWANMKKNTESLGSIFDAQPSTAQGNIQCISDRTRPAIGYVSVGTVQSKRIFIDATDLRGFHALPKDLCSITSRVMFADLPNSKCFPTPGHLIVDLIYNSNVPVGVTETNDYCADCTLRGTLKTPSFWK